MIKVLVVDDSRVMTKIISRILEKDPLIEVVGTAGSGSEAIEKIEKLKPEVVTLDVEMPGMNGIEALRHIMSTNPLPVIMLSTLTRDHADITMEALSIGACDFVTKDFSNSTFADKEQELIGKVKDVARNRAKLRLKGLAQPRAGPPSLPRPGGFRKTEHPFHRGLDRRSARAPVYPLPSSEGLSRPYRDRPAYAAALHPIFCGKAR